MGDKKKEYRDKRTGMQTVRSAIFAIVLIITGFISIIYVADNTYAADEYRVHKSEVVVKTGATYTVKILNHDTKVSPKKFKWTSSNSKCVKVINGRIYGLKPGQATITAQMSGLKVNCEVFVYNKTETVLFKKYKKQVKVTAGKTILLLIKRWQLYQRKEKLLQKRREMSKSPVFLMVLTDMYQR